MSNSSTSGFGFNIRGGAEYNSLLYVSKIAYRGAAEIDGRLRVCLYLYCGSCVHCMETIYFSLHTVASLYRMYTYHSAITACMHVYNYACAHNNI